MKIRIAFPSKEKGMMIFPMTIQRPTRHLIKTRHCYHPENDKGISLIHKFKILYTTVVENHFSQKFLITILCQNNLLTLDPVLTYMIETHKQSAEKTSMLIQSKTICLELINN